jgi:hypothetical protein
MKTKPDLNLERMSHEKVNNIIKEVTDKIVAPTKTFRDEIVERANLITKEIHDEFMRQNKIRIIPMTKKDAVDSLCELYKIKYNTWTKDELLENLSLLQACYHGESYHNSLI